VTAKRSESKPEKMGDRRLARTARGKGESRAKSGKEVARKERKNPRWQEGRRQTRTRERRREKTREEAQERRRAGKHQPWREEQARHARSGRYDPWSQTWKSKKSSLGNGLRLETSPGRLATR
jgi:hypothetical protein